MSKPNVTIHYFENGDFVDHVDYMALDKYAVDLQNMLDIAEQALSKIANEDFRGNRPQASTDAYNALTRIRVARAAQEVMETHADTFKKLAEND